MDAAREHRTVIGRYAELLEKPDKVIFMKALVTGGAGCIGSEVVKALLKTGNDVTVFDNFSSGKEEHIEEFRNESRFHLIEGDILDVGALENATKNNDIVFHLAANPDIKFSAR